MKLITANPIGFFKGISTYPLFKKSQFPSLRIIASEWDSNVLSRSSELESKSDCSYYHDLLPNIVELLHRYVRLSTDVIDIGSGLGYLSNYIADEGYYIQGVDISKESIRYASKKFPDIKFHHLSIIDFSRQHHSRFTACVSNMVFHNIHDLQSNLFAVNEMLVQGGVLIVSIPHPRTWSEIHIPCNHFVYEEEKTYHVTFKIRNGGPHPSQITYFHRPLSSYVDYASMVGFEKIDTLGREFGDQVPPDIVFLVFRKRGLIIH